jgi:hypothetical protein
MTMRARTGVLLLTAVLALIACGGKTSPSSSSGDPSASGDPSPSGSTAGVSTTAASTASPSTSLPATPANLVAYIQAGHELSPETYADASGTLVSFSTPSGNISCGFAITDSWVMCWIKENWWPSIAASTCDVGDWGPNWVTASSDGVKRGACLSEQPYPMPGEVLPYGSTISIGSIGCRSESTFLACAHLGTRNGFVISKATYHTYGPVIA